MSADSRLEIATQPLVRRASVVEFWKLAMPGVAIALLVGQGLWIGEIRDPFVFVALLTAVLAVSAVAAMRRRPGLIEVARRVDKRGGLQDLVVSAIDARGDGLAVLVRNDAVAALARQAPSDIYPLELPARWRQIAVAALAAEAVLVALTWQTPASRASVPSLASMEMPAANNATSPQTSRPTQQTPSNSVAAADPSSISNAAGAMKPVGDANSADNRRGAETALTAAAGADRIRLAAAHAESDITAGRVPAAKRAMVERYFAALQAQKKTPR